MEVQRLGGGGDPKIQEGIDEMHTETYNEVYTKKVEDLRRNGTINAEQVKMLLEEDIRPEEEYKTFWDSLNDEQKADITKFRNDMRDTLWKNHAKITKGTGFRNWYRRNIALEASN